MKILITLLISAFSIMNVFAYEHERIMHYHSDIAIQKNCEVIITETIKVYAKGYEIQRGIFRDIPLSYNYKGGSYHVDFELLSVKKDGAEEDHHTARMDNGIRIYIGNESMYLDEGEYTYEIKYTVDHVLLFYENFDELYWNVNGNGWTFPLDSISATVYVPGDAKILQYDGFTGRKGEKGDDFIISTDSTASITYHSARKFNSGENLTVAVAWDKGHLDYPSTFEKLLFWMKTYIVGVVCGLGLLISFLYNFIMWFRYGRDPKPGTIIPRFYPPEGFSPAECAYLKKSGKYSKEIFGAQLVQLAVKGYIDLKKKTKNYTVTRLSEKNHKEELNVLEELFFTDLLGSKDSLYISSTYNSRIKKAFDNLKKNMNTLQKGKYFLRNTHLKWRQYVLPVITIILAFILGYMYGGSPWIFLGTIVLFITKNIIFSRLFEQPTKLGRQKMDEIAGFEMYIKYADELRIKANNPPDMNFEYFEKNLPYAIALGLAEEWKGQFKIAEVEEWSQHRMPYLTGISIAALSTMSSDISSKVSSASTPPTSSSGGSGGFSSGGGGFSGGGFGGGGGGGW